MLSQGNDRANHLHYHREAARVLAKLELTDEARRMLERAAALAEDDEEQLAAVNEQLEALGD